MKKTIYPKLIIGYLLFGILGFTVVSTITSHFSYQYIKKNEISNLYKEANLIASDYAVSYYSNYITLSDFESRLKAIHTYLTAQIWVIDREGNILVDSAKNSDPSNMEAISDFNISDFKNHHYQTGFFYDYGIESKQYKCTEA